MDGFLFLNQAKSLCPTVPVIMITGYASIDTAVSAIKWGAFDYLKKPYEISKIYSVIKQALQSSESN
jgi:DNA-binding NtrC family response regulator